MSSESYVISEDSDGAIVVTLDQVVINSIPAGIATTLTDLIPQRTFTHIERARYFTCDNGTEHGYYLTETNQYVGPHISGVRLPLTHATTQAHVQARNDSLSWIVPVTGERSVITFYDSDPGAQSTGTQNPAVTTSMIVSPDGWQANQTEDSYGTTDTIGSALLVASGYDSNTADGIYIPARTANVYLNTSAVDPPAGARTTVLSYTAPAGLYWRLLWATLDVDNGTALPEGRYGMCISEPGLKTIIDLQGMNPCGAYSYSKEIMFPANGIKAAVPGSNLVIQIYIDTTSANLVARASAALYVGP